MKWVYGVKLLFSAMLMLWLTACASLQGESVGPTNSNSSNGVVVGHGDSATSGKTASGSITPSYSNANSNRESVNEVNKAYQSEVTSSLLSTAKKQRDNKQYANATATLERAVRIAPKDPEPFKQLAQVKFDQGRFNESEQMARKALVLAEGQDKPGQQSYSSDYLADLWDIVAEARSRLGDRAGANKAREKASDLRTNY
ncbi:MAG TPA: hypothetical protein VFM46_05610 [Pseudomonadales bacterium]|nr:hypothetical protein [Pseudomonadales bacterium]